MQGLTTQVVKTALFNRALRPCAPGAARGPTAAEMLAQVPLPE